MYADRRFVPSVFDPDESLAQAAHERAQALPFPVYGRRAVVWHGHRHERAQALSPLFGGSSVAQAPPWAGSGAIVL